jgi:hypothetical protein
VSRITTYKCDRCGAVLEGEEGERKAVLRMNTAAATWTADLCGACCEQIRTQVDFLMKSRKKRAKARIAA